MSFNELLNQSFVHHALLASLLVSIACGIIGALVVVNRLVFMAGGIAHTAYGGIGLAFYTGLPILPTAGAFSGTAAILLGLFSRKRQERTDTMIGVLWAGGMAFGIILMGLSPGYNVDLMSYLFGSILTVPADTLWLMLGIDLIILALISYYLRDILSLSYDPDFARSRGVPVDTLRLMLLVLIAETIVMMIQVVGLILVIALLTIPSSLAERHTRSLSGMMIASAMWSVLCCLGGLVVSFQFDLSSGACIIALACCVFLVYVSLESLLKKNRPHRASAE